MVNNKKKIVIGKRLIDEGWFAQKKEAQAWIMSGKVLVNNNLVHSFFDKFPEDAIIRVKEYYKRKYVNKGGLKLEGAIRDFNIDINNLVALDCGASTGGFSDCLLQSGARLVYAVEVGFGQLAGKLFRDNRVINLEKTNLGDEKLLNLDPKPELITLDLSYLSLTKAMPICKRILGDEGEVICLVKPLFEVESSEVRRSGDINDYNILKEILENLCEHFEYNGYNVLGVIHSQVTGNKGTLEYFLHINWGKSSDVEKYNYMEGIDIALHKSFELDKFNKTSNEAVSKFLQT